MPIKKTAGRGESVVILIVVDTIRTFSLLINRDQLHEIKEEISFEEYNDDT